MAELVHQQTVVRLAAFAGIFLVMALWELLAPRRAQAMARPARWPSNLGIAMLDALLTRLLFPITTAGVAIIADSHGLGLLRLLGAPVWVNIACSVVVLDLAIYAQHVVFHSIPALWRLHRMHHTDPELDVTSGARFHPLEILISVALKMGLIVLLGVDAVAVVVFEVLLNATAMFNHGNVRMPGWLDRLARYIVVTPDMHRVHHSIEPSETDSNFGFNLPWWDYAFRTYRAAPAGGHAQMVIGQPMFRGAGEQRLDRLLTQPFRRHAT
jgi:sterol desaturase/sphingolipid hydroxylase (fatty acid hydroxylase superfamily)